jgi:hypothetical protein
MPGSAGEGRQIRTKIGRLVYSIDADVEVE